MEDESIFDIAFLLGIDFLSEHISKCRKEIIHLLLQVTSKFSRSLTKIIENLVLSQSFEKVSMQLSISTNLVDMFMYKGIPSGVCNICDRYFMKLQYHLRCQHSLPKSLVEEHAKLYRKDFYFYQPRAFKTVEYEKPLNENKHLSRKQANRIFELGDMGVEMAPAYFAYCSENTNNILCVECGRIIPKGQRAKHNALHRRADCIECVKCGTQMYRRLLNTHMKTCSAKMPVALEQ